MEESITALLPMLESEEEEERAKAARALVILGQVEKALPVIQKNALQDDLWFQASADVLHWLPYESRTDLYFQLTADDEFKDSFGSVLTNYTKVKNPGTAQNIWKLINRNSLGGSEALDALNKAYFGDVGRYQGLKEQGVEKQTILNAVADAKLLLDDPDPKKNVIALAFLYDTGHESVVTLSKNIAKSTGNSEVRQMALRVALLIQEDDAEALAIEFLKTVEDKSVGMLLRYLCLGKDTLQRLPGNDEFYFYGRDRNHYSSPSSVKVIVPKPPEGLQSSDIERLVDHKDLGTRGLVNYLQVLMKESKEIDTLLEYFAENDSDEVAKLVYQAISVIDDDKLSSHLDEIYEQHAKDSNWFAGPFYWTIRPMSGQNVLKLRSRMRREIGLENLNSYR